MLDTLFRRRSSTKKKKKVLIRQAEDVAEKTLATHVAAEEDVGHSHLKTYVSLALHSKKV